MVNSRHVHSLRILHVLTTPRAEGTPNLVLDWLAAGTECWQGVLVLNSHPADLADRLRTAAHAYEEHDLFGSGYRKFFRIAGVAHAAVRQHRPDVVICWPTGFANWVCAGAFAAGCRRLLVHAGNPTYRSRKTDWLTRYVMWPLTAMRAKVVCCSDYVRDSYRSTPGVARGLFHTVYNCSRAKSVEARANGARSSRPAGDRPTAVMVATLEGHKDHATLLRAIPLVTREHPTFRLRLIGNGSLMRPLRELAQELGVGSVVEFLGARNDVPELLGQADFFVFSTTPQEGLGSVLLEALAAGLPVIASDVPACRELLAGRWGTLVPPADPVALAQVICDHLASPPALDTGVAGVGYAKEFSPVRMIDEYLRTVGIGRVAERG